MNGKLKMYIEKTDNSRYAAAAFDGYDKLINYQVRMLTNNKIRYLLHTAMQQTDNNVIMYYDITDKISVSEYAKKERFNLSQFLNFLNTLVKIDDEIEEFQLINSGLVFDPDWVFVDLNGENSEYIYIPNVTEPTDADEIRTYLLQILGAGYIDASAQELVAQLFMLLQNPDMSMRDIKDLIYRFEDREKRFNFNIKNSPRDEDSEQVLQNSSPMKKNIPFKSASKPMIPKKKPEIKDKRSYASKKDIPKAKPDIMTDDNDQQTEKEEKSTLPRTLAFAGNALALALIYEIYTLGYLSNETGLDFTKIGVLIGAVVIIDVIVIKELLFADKNNEKKQNKAKKEKVKKEKIKKEKQPKAKKVPFAFNEDKNISEITDFKVKPEIPSVKESIEENKEKLHSMAAVLPQLSPKPQPSKSDKIKENFEIESEKSVKILPKKSTDFTSDKGLFMTAEINSGIENEETVLMINEEPRGYIERYEGDKSVDKYIIKKDNVIIGRLRSHVDMTVLNPKVGKIHAEIIHKDGEFYIKDLSSKNGTYLENKTERITTETEYKLSDGEKFRLADSSFCIHFIN